MRPVEEARAHILERTPTLPAESLFLGDAAGRLLAEELASFRNLPPADNSAMDGYGVRAADCAGASDDAPKALKVLGPVLAGDSVVGRAPVGEGEAVRIMTGAPIPPGVDAVIMREQTDEDGVGDDHTGTVNVKIAPDAGAHIRRKGEDVGEGRMVGKPGQPITAARLNLLASAGHVVVQVRRRPRVAIFASGDELRELGRPATDDDIINSNAHAIAAAVRAAGAVPQMLGIAADTLEDHVKRIEAAGFADVLLTIGGVSMGTHDFVRPAFEKVGADLEFWKVAMRPGKPLAFGRRGEQLVFGLPGNPVSSQVSFELFVRPALRRMMGQQEVVRRTMKATLVDSSFKKRPGVAFYARAQATMGDDGRLTAKVSSKQSSGQISAMAEGNALVVIPREAEGVSAGDEVDVLLLEPSIFFSA